MKNTLRFALPVLCLLILSCTNDSESDLLLVEGTDDSAVDDGVEATVTYSNDIEPIISANCLSCHSSPPRNGAPFSLVTFDQVRARSSAVLRTVSLQTGEPGAMPPAARIPQSSIDLIALWIDEGLAE